MTGPYDPNDPNQTGPQQPYQQPPYGGQPPPYQGQQPPYQGQQPPYPGQPYGYPQPPAQQVGLLERLGPRALQRPQPRLGTALGGVGVGLVVAGVLVWSFTYLFEGLFADISSSGGGAPDDSRRFLGAALGALAVVAGYALILRAGPGALRTAGVVATALGVPVLMEFLSFDLTGGTPINVDVVVWVSVLAYLISYFFVRNARGHSLYLGLSLLQIWGYVIDKVDGNALTSATTSGLRIVPGFSGAPSTPSPDVDVTALGITSLLIGLLYYAAAFVLDRRGRHGVALAFVVAGLPAVAFGIGALSSDLEQIGSGIVLIVVGFALAAYGARFERRFTTWAWAAAGAGGFVVILTEIADTGISAGVSLIVIGVVVVLAGWRLGPLLHETPDIDEGVGAPVVAAPRQH